MWDGRLIQVSVAGVNSALRFLHPCHCHVMQPLLLNLFTLKDLHAHPSSPCWKDGWTGWDLGWQPERKAHSINLLLVWSEWESLKVTYKLQGCSHQRDALKVKVLGVQGVLLLYPISPVCCCIKLEWFPQVVCLCNGVCTALTPHGEISSIDQEGRQLLSKLTGHLPGHLWDFSSAIKIYPSNHSIN